MKEYTGEQIVKQLEKRKGGYFFLKLDSTIVNQFKNRRQTRFICTIDGKVNFQCGLNHLGDGNFFIIISRKNLESIGKQPGDTIQFHLKEDPNPLGVEIPEVLEVMLAQDQQLKEKFNTLTPGGKRSVIHQMKRIKDLDKQISRTIELINNADKPRQRRS